MELGTVTQIQQEKTQTAVQIAAHKKALEEQERIQKLVDNLPAAPGPPGLGVNVDATA
jgi:hypothetical protein